MSGCFKPPAGRAIVGRTAAAALAALVISPVLLAGTLNPTTTARYVGSYGLEVVVGDTSPAWVRDDSPA